MSKTNDKLQYELMKILAEHRKVQKIDFSINREDFGPTIDAILKAILAALPKEKGKNPYPTHKGKIVKNWDAINLAWTVGYEQALEEVKRVINGN